MKKSIVAIILLSSFWLMGSLDGSAKGTVKEKVGDNIEDQGSQIALWVRKPGNYSDGHFSQEQPRKIVSLDEIKAKKPFTKFDLQYEKNLSFKGVSLGSLIASFNGLGSGVDLAILHFDNGMGVPLPLSDVDKVDAYIAREIQVKKAWLSDFPELPKDKDFKDPRPLRFVGNKLVVSKGWHPLTNPKEKGDFSPWIYVSSLTGIEFVNEAAYFNQFLVSSDPLMEAGLEVFKQRCQYCHGVRRVGATYGWDFVDPLPTYKQKTPENIFLHVKYPKFDANKRGLMMPPQTSISKKEAEVLWAWMKGAAELKLKPYQP
jgi:mono/diheme cytochrome c family protein